MVQEKNNTIEEAVIPTTTVKVDKFEEIISPGKIKVQILETPMNMSPVPGEEMISGQNEAINSVPQSGEVMHVRKCVSGFTRDQKGRCRRVRKPGSSSSL